MGSPTPTSTYTRWLSRTRSRRRSYQSAAEISGGMSPAASYRSGPGLARDRGHARAIAPGYQRVRVCALAPAGLSRRSATPRLAAGFHAPLPDGGAEQLVLPAAEQVGVSRVARAGARRLR